ncbi:hypothetical protein PBT90_08980 [Algoriphagus halophytocola]|uniref:HPt domain-containing protein n=1 Tax=Algoriphagus halophytocola TaxID=2991499 RepID=A0ABY6MIB8_9BACT|nr:MULTISPECIES: hypothetical protein [unclassified Algoriphagus]UZD23520.1 hypothetical protein OM944_03305 [Algoriphagus sp. TR-M5]WBL44814.1 hypothetical protein PBT90_08980 [Algoriphagus sp. TR-M9]
MEKVYPDLSSLIEEMSDGDQDFQKELTQAILLGLEELKVKYAAGLEQKNENIIQQIRHKIKPTLVMFGLAPIIDEMQVGKELLEQKGFDTEFELHYQKLMKEVEVAIQCVTALID